ncbi:MAG TPA: FtsX-like permease family protein [Candidatus Saccharimonadales bacterium]|nr:FtsX-like permease family protein [Candidatus Saccharimonadales bacterium]
MTTATFILKNALRNKRRAVLSVLSVAVSLFLFVTLLVFLRELTLPPEDIGASLRIVVRSKVSIANPLPYRQRAIIEKIPGVDAISPFTWFGGKFRGEPNITFAQFAMDAKQLTNIFGEAKLPQAQLDNFIKDQTACIIGKITADKHKLKIGDKVQLTSIIYPCAIDLKLAGIYAGSIDDRNMLFHHKYLEEACDTAGQVGTWWVKARSADEMPSVIKAINDAFANTSSEVRAETERAFQLSFISMLGNIKTLIASICSVVVFTLVLVTASTMSMAIRERFRELAVLKALGYQRSQLFAFILAESFGLAIFGAIVGAGGAWLFYTQVDISKLTDGMLISFEVTPRILGTAFSIAACLGIVASIAPAISVARMSVVGGLKTLD